MLHPEMREGLGYEVICIFNDINIVNQWVNTSLFHRVTLIYIFEFDLKSIFNYINLSKKNATSLSKDAPLVTLTRGKSVTKQEKNQQNYVVDQSSLAFAEKHG